MFNNIIKIAATLTLASFALVSCIEVEDPQVGELGYLSAPSLDVDVTVDDLTQTKAEDYGITSPEESEIHFVVKDKDSKVVYDAKGLWTEPLVMPVGAYSIEASAGENGFGIPYFVGSASGTVGALGNEVPSLSLSVANALLKVTVAQEFAQHFIGKKVIVNSGAYETSFEQWFFVPAGLDLTLTLVGDNSTGKEVTFSHSLAAPSAKVAYRVECTKDSNNWPSIAMAAVDVDNVWGTVAYVSPASFANISDANKAEAVYEAIPSASSDWSSAVNPVAANGMLLFEGLSTGTEYKVRARVGALTSNEVTFTPSVDGLTVAAAHTYTNSELDGTDVTSSFSKSDLVKSAIDSWTINLCKADGTVLRSGLALGTSDGSAITATDGWPYLPVGSYKLVCKATMKDGKEVNAETAFSTSNPSFNVTASAYTSYNKYLLRDLTFANNADNKYTVFERKASVSISNNILSNTNYAGIRSSSITFNSANLGTFNTNSKDFGNDANCTSWQNYPFKATMTFDGVTKESSVDCHITGLPYTAAPPKIEGLYAWTFKGGTAEVWSGNDEYAKLGNGAAGTSSLTSPYFHVPGDIKVNIASKYYVKCDNFLGGKNIFTLKLGGTQILETTIKGSNNTTKEESSDANMSTSNNYIICSNSYGLGLSHSKVYYINVKYN